MSGEKPQDKPQRAWPKLQLPIDTKILYTAKGNIPYEVEIVLEKFESARHAFHLADALRGLASKVERRAREMQEQEKAGTAAAPATGDRFVGVEEVSKMLGKSHDWVYRNKEKIGGLVKQGRAVQFSERALEAWMASRVRRGG